jgi:serine phosphatase RsbU (regulator of sigma subunit)
MSLLMVRWDEKNKKMFMTWAWHEYLMIYKQKQKRCFRLKSGWVALWMIKNIHKLTKEQQISFEPNDIIILYSDWVTEAINKPKRDWNEQMFWEDRLQKAIEDAPNIAEKDFKSARTIFNHISIQLSKFMWYNPIQLDDITLVTIEYKAPDYKEENDIPLEIPEDLYTEWKWKK